MDPVEVIVTVVRVWAGVVMLAHGFNHARNLDGTAKWFGKVGFKAARRQAQASAFGEIAIGSSLVLGLLTTFGAFGLVAVMTVAFWSIHRFAGFFVFARPDEGYEYVVTLTGIPCGPPPEDCVFMKPGDIDEGEPCGDSTNGGCNSTPATFGAVDSGESV
ncbi:MAG: DoxX family protein, partial [Acidimicrobiia bacterium]|nr:DoxX family protein [Acidimicrobiia bacterium]